MNDPVANLIDGLRQAVPVREETQQPKWKLVANLGDKNPIDHGGYFVYVDQTGVYPPEAALLESPETDAGTWTAWRFVLDPCTFTNGVLSDNKFHPDKPAWFADDLDKLAQFVGQTKEQLIELFTSDDPLKRAQAWRAVGDYFGYENLDGDPLQLSREEAERKYGNQTVAESQGRKLKESDGSRFTDVTPEEYASFWGCDPVYDKPPREKGDGYMFYNFSVEQGNPEFLKKFLGAIDRTIQGLDSTEQDDIDDLGELKAYVEELLQSALSESHDILRYMGGSAAAVAASKSGQTVKFSKFEPALLERLADRLNQEAPQHEQIQEGLEMVSRLLYGSGVKVEARGAYVDVGGAGELTVIYDPLLEQFVVGTWNDYLQAKRLNETSNEDVIYLFLTDSFPKDKKSNWGVANLRINKELRGWSLVNYTTPILYRSNGSSEVAFNAQKYSQTTTKIQNAIRHLAVEHNVKLTETDGNGMLAIMRGSPLNTGITPVGEAKGQVKEGCAKCGAPNYEGCRGELCPDCAPADGSTDRVKPVKESLELPEPKDAAGNWQSFDSFAWMDQPEDAENWFIFYTNNRDSGFLEQSNAAVIAEELKPFIEAGDVNEERHRHWAVGWVDGYSVRVFDEKGNVTPAFQKLQEIAEKLDNYPVLDEEDYSKRQYDATLENIQSVGRKMVKKDAPADWPSQVFSWFWDNLQGAVEDDGQDQGGYPSDDEMKQALTALDLISEEHDADRAADLEHNERLLTKKLGVSKFAELKRMLHGDERYENEIWDALQKTGQAGVDIATVEDLLAMLNKAEAHPVVTEIERLLKTGPTEAVETDKRKVTGELKETAGSKKCNSCGNDKCQCWPGGIPAAACPKCGGWTSQGGMSQHANATAPVMGRKGCTCNKAKVGEAAVRPGKVNPFKAGDQVQLKADALGQHARSIPAHMGYTTEQFAWRDTLRKVKGKVGTVERTFPNSKHTNVEWDGVGCVGLDWTMLDPAGQAAAANEGTGTEADRDTEGSCDHCSNTGRDPGTGKPCWKCHGFRDTKTGEEGLTQTGEPVKEAVETDKRQIKGRGISDKATADEMASRVHGKVVTDEDDATKFMVIVEESKTPVGTYGKLVCKVCGDVVATKDQREHLISHNPNAEGMETEDVAAQFELQETVGDSFEEWFAANKDSDQLAEGYREYVHETKQSSGEKPLVFQAWAKQRYEAQKEMGESAEKKFLKKLSLLTEAEQPDLAFYRDGNGDYLVVDKTTSPLLEGRATAVAGDRGSVCSTTISPEYLKGCTAVERKDVPKNWFAVLVGAGEKAPLRALHEGYSTHEISKAEFLKQITGYTPVSWSTEVGNDENSANSWAMSKADTFEVSDHDVPRYYASLKLSATNKKNLFVEYEQGGVNEKSVSQKQQKFMGMVHAQQQGKLKHPSAAVKQAAGTMTKKAATDFAATKRKGLPTQK